MWKVVIADDEGVILQGLKKLIDWKNVDVELVGEARDGQQLKKVIEQTDPDIVIADIMMPHMTGLEVIRWYNEMHSHAKFIFVSGYQEFTYAKEALQSGAVDYLLKPVARKDFEDAVRKAIQKLEEQNTIEIFKEEDDEMQNLFREINDGQGFENAELYQLFEEEEINFADHFLLESVLVSVRMWHQIWLMIPLNVLIWCASLFIIRSVRNYGERHLCCARTTVRCILWACFPVERKILSWKPT